MLLNYIILRGIEGNAPKDVKILISDEHCPETTQKARRDAFAEGFNISSNSITVPLKLIITQCSYKWLNEMYFYNMFVA